MPADTLAPFILAGEAGGTNVRASAIDTMRSYLEPYHGLIRQVGHLTDGYFWAGTKRQGPGSVRPVADQLGGGLPSWTTLAK